MKSSSDVGYGKPPKNTRFTKGVSGNRTAAPRAAVTSPPSLPKRFARRS